MSDFKWNYYNILYEHIKQGKGYDTIYTYLYDDNDENNIQFTYNQLNNLSQQISFFLSAKLKKGSRVILAFPYSHYFIASFLACLRSGVIAVPIPLNLKKGKNESLIALANDAKCSMLLTEFAVLQKHHKNLLDIFNLENNCYVAVDKIPKQSKSIGIYNAKKDDIAFLQYTSGSTGHPKGVMVSHENLRENSKLIYKYFNPKKNKKVVSWLPHFHDMGLIGGYLQPLYGGYPVVLINPLQVLKKPILWLESISKHKASISGGPNFIYDLCKNRITKEQIKDLDLSCWKVAFSGAEKVRFQTLEDFSSYFHQSSFDPKSFTPCYGMAETTLLISSKQGGNITKILVDKKKIESNEIVLSKNEGIELVSVGKVRNNDFEEVLIINSKNQKKCRDNIIGEIWVKGKSVAKGYWNNKKLSEKTFNASIGEDSGYLRTGDLGCIVNEHLYITGRLKDMILIRGRNIYPDDIEALLSKSIVQINVGGITAFSIEKRHTEVLIISLEINRIYLKNFDLEKEKITQQIRLIVLEYLGIQVEAILFCKPFTLAKTTSGKIRRSKIKSDYLNNTINTIYVSEKNDILFSKNGIYNNINEGDEIEYSIKKQISSFLKIPIDEIDVNTPFLQFGLDSLQSVELVAILEKELNLTIEPTIFYDYPTVYELSSYIKNIREDTALKKTKKKVLNTSNNDECDIAIIGMGCRFPAANNVDQFWDVILNQKNGINKFSEKRSYISKNSINKKIEAGYIDNIENYDPAFFEIPIKNAPYIDPQQRLVLEVAWQALEQAGIPAQAIKGSDMGVFIGTSSQEYLSYLRDQNSEPYNIASILGNSSSIVANRLSYFLDIHGPSIAIDTACSSSLVAINQAVESLRNNKCSMAIAGGVNSVISEDLTKVFYDAGMISSNNQCRTFDKKANGYVRGEGCGIVLLKKVSEAQKSGDSILGVIRGLSINQDGRSNGITAPNGRSQQKVITAAMKDANILPSEISYIEAHGTGTILGDPIEVNSLVKIFQDESKKMPCYIGSIKPNIGHLESAAGIAGFIKAILCIQNKIIPANRNFEELNPYIKLEGSTIKIVEKSVQWNQENRIAGVSSFGFGGTNAHVIMSNFKEKNLISQSKKPSYNAFVLSAKNKESFEDIITRYHTFLSGNQDIDITKLCYTLQIGRDHFKEYRIGVFANKLNTIINTLSSILSKDDVGKDKNWYIKEQRKSKNREVVFLFSGQGSDYIGMGKDLYRNYNFFKSYVEKCDKIILKYAQISIKKAFTSSSKDIKSYNDKEIQLILFTLEYALANFWIQLGLVPSMLMGHSFGEICATCIAGVIDLDSAIFLTNLRAKLIEQTPEGYMLTVMVSEHKMKNLISKNNFTCSIAAVNGPNLTTISGTLEEKAFVLEKMKENNILAIPMSSSKAFHSSAMNSLKDVLLEELQSIKFNKPSTPLISNVLGEVINKNSPHLDYYCSPLYWSDHCTNPVLFQTGMENLSNKEDLIFIEIGPKSSLINMGKKILTSTQNTWFYSLKPEEELTHLYQNICKIYTLGIPINFDLLYDGQKLGRYNNLPNYPFKREYHWIQKIDSKIQTITDYSKETFPFLNPFEEKNGELISTVTINENISDFLSEHLYYGKVIFPASAYLDVLFNTVQSLSASSRYTLEEIIIKKVLLLDKDSSYFFRVRAIKKENVFKIYIESLSSTSSHKNWNLHLEAFAIKRKDYARGKIKIESLKKELTPFENIYAYINASKGTLLELNEDYICEVYSSDTKILIRVKTDKYFSSKHRVYPPLLTNALSSIGILKKAKIDDFMITAFKGAQMYEDCREEFWAYIQFTTLYEKFKLEIFNNQGKNLVTVDEVQVQDLSKEKFQKEQFLYKIQWENTTLFNHDIPLIKHSTLQQEIDLETHLGIKDYVSEMQFLEEKSVNYIIKAYVKIGWNFAVGDYFTLETISAQLSITYTHIALFIRTLQILEEEKYLHKKEGQWKVIKEFSQQPSHPINFEYLSSELKLLDICAQELHNVFTGNNDALDVLFPNGNTSLVDSLYKDTFGAKILNDTVYKIIQLIYKNLDYGRGLKILEIGGGTGGITFGLLPLLDPERTTYTFTDIGAIFINKAKQKYKKYPFVTCEVLDIENEPVAQNFSLGDYDLIIAANVVHATKDIEKTITHIHSLLANKGTLILVEGVNKQRWLDLTFGYTSGWWAFNDKELRKEYPLLNLTQWKQVLKKNGFDHISTLNPFSKEKKSSQYIIYSSKQTKIKTRNSSKWLLLRDVNVTNCLIEKTLTNTKILFDSAHFLLDKKENIGININSTWQNFDTFISQKIDLYDQIVYIPKKSNSPKDFVSTKNTILLLQSLLQRTQKQKVSILTSGVQSKNIISKATISQSILSGIVRTAQMEYPEKSLQWIDLQTSKETNIKIALEVLQYGASDHKEYIISNNTIQIPKLKLEDRESLEQIENKKISSEKTYLITGGMRGIGWKMVEWLLLKGAKHICVVARSKPDDILQDEVTKHAEKGITILAKQLDVTDEIAVNTLIEKLDKSPYPLGGVIHCAAVFNSQLIKDITWSAAKTVLEPKTIGAWHLHNATQQIDLDFFVLFSSASGILGMPGMAIYAGANTYLDALAHYRNQLDLPSLSVNWGVWSDVGFAAKQSEDYSLYWKTFGLVQMNAEKSLSILEDILFDSREIQYGIFDLHLSKQAGRRQNSLFSLLEYSDKNSELIILIDSIKNQKKSDKIKELLSEYVQLIIANTLGGKKQSDSTVKLNELGFDSLLGLDLKNRIQKDLKVSITIESLMEGCSIQELTEQIYNEFTVSTIGMAKEDDNLNYIEI